MTSVEAENLTSRHTRRTLAFEDLELDQDSRTVRRAGRLIELTPTEFKLLHYLMTNPNRVLTKGQILDRVWGQDYVGSPTVVETYVCYLRRKVDAGAPRLLHTRRGTGYVLARPDRHG